MPTHAEQPHSRGAVPPGRAPRGPRPGSQTTSPEAARVLHLQRAAGNRAVTGHLAPSPAVQREPAAVSFDEAINGSDPDALKPFRPFPALSMYQVRKICRLVIDKNLIVGPDDENTLESAWRAVGGERNSLTEADWQLWKECEDYGAEIKLVPWMYEARMTFAERVRAAALRNVESNVKAIDDEAKRLGIALDGGAPPAPSREADEAVAQQRGLANLIKEAKAKLQALRKIPVGYEPRSWGTTGDKEDLPPGGQPDEVEAKQFATFDPDKAPPSRAEPDPHPDAGIAKYEVVKALHDEMTTAVGDILNANPALYAIAARGGTDTILGEDTAAVRAQMATALRDVLANAAKTKADIESRSLSFSEMVPVHQAVARSDPQYQGAFAKKLAADYIEEDGGAEAAASKAVSLVTIALITAVEVASGGTATPVVGALISLAASAGTAAASWNDWAKLETAAKSTVSDRNAIVTQEQADNAQLGALISTAAALFDVYGAGKAVRAASAGAQATVKALEGRVSDAAKLKQISQGVVVGNAREVVERSVTNLGPAATVRNVRSWQKLASTLGGESPAMAKLSAWRSEAFEAAEAAATKAAVGQQGEAARATLAIASGLEQAALGEALDAVIEVISGEGDGQMGQIGVGGKQATLDIEAIADQAAAKHPASRAVQRSMVDIVEVPLSRLKLAAMSPAEFERIIRQGTSSGYFSAQGLPRMTVLDAKLHGGGHGYDGLGISKQGNLIQLYNLECKHVVLDSDHLPALGATRSGTQGGLQWSGDKAKLMLSGANPYADETLEDLAQAIRKRVGKFDERILEDTLADALRSSRFYLFTPVWAKTEMLLAQMRGLASSGLAVGKLIRVAPRGWRP